MLRLKSARLVRAARVMAAARSGSIAIEYALIAMVVSVGIFAAVQSTGVQLVGLLTSVTTAFSAAK